MKTVTDFMKARVNGDLISVVTCYDYWSARIIDESDVDAILVGDSAAMVMHGYETTINADIEMMAFHTASVKRGLKNKLLIADMPFLANRTGLTDTMKNVDKLMKAGAQAIKIEGAEDQLESIHHIIQSGVPVMGHLGLTPQSVHKFGGFKVQGKKMDEAQAIVEYAMKLQDIGCFAIVLELLPSDVAKKITEKLSIPTIGIGAGKFTSGQVLVLHDLLGFDEVFKPKFLKTFLDGNRLVKNALNQYNAEVKENSFPNESESY